MARRRSSFPKAAAISSGALVFCAAVIAAALLLSRKGDSYSDLPSFPVDAYLAGGNLWSYDEYRLNGRVDNIIYRSRTSDRLVASVELANSKIRLPVVIEVVPGGKSLQVEQSLAFKVTLGPGGEILCREFKAL